MNKKDLGMFATKLLGFAGVLLAVHYYIFYNFFSELELYLPIWSVYVFNVVLVFAVYAIINYQMTNASDQVLNIFLGSTMVKMVLALVFLLPIFLDKTPHVKTEIFNFFIPYFLFLGFEIYALNKFFKNV